MTRLLFLFVLVGLCAGGILAQQTTAFSYQGRLNNSLVPANGVYDFRFELYKTPIEELPLGTVIIEDVQVTNGLFTVSLDFGGKVFMEGADRYLDISVKIPTEPTFTRLTPRLPLLAVPYANRSINAQIADVAVTALSAGNAANLAGIPASNFLQINGDGSNLTNVRGAIPWQLISGNVLAGRNRGYIVSSDNEVEIFLPTSPQIGDVVRIAWGEGNGNYLVRTNLGQTITRSKTPVAALTWPAFGPASEWRSVAASADGLKLAALLVQANTAEQFIYTSTDGGLTWAQRINYPASPTIRQISSSADGASLAIIRSNGEIITSSDSGATWVSRLNIESGRSIAVSADGQNIVACADSGFLYRSSTSGSTWSMLKTAGNRGWSHVALSANGTHMIAAETNSGGLPLSRVWVSHDSGASWNPFLTPSVSWTQVAVSADGSRMAASGNELYYSTDSGATWNLRVAGSIVRALTMSANGLKLMAIQGNGSTSRLITSDDGGENWMMEESPRNWSAVATSADFSRLYAAAGQIRIKPSATVSGGLRGDGAVELLHVGSGKFTVISSSGGLSYF